VDQNANGSGEFGFFQELTGDEIPRTRTAPLAAATFTSGALGRTSGGIATKSGYHYLIYLPTATGVVAESDGPAAAVPQDAPEQETAWVCYAWPTNYGVTGNRAFVVNQDGTVCFSLNDDPATCYRGTTSVPDAFAAYIATHSDGLLSPLATRPGDASADGANWRPVPGG
jgi:hypothetical protein